MCDSFLQICLNVRTLVRILFYQYHNSLIISILVMTGIADAFLFQLRAFQEVRGKVLNPNQISISLTNIRNASQELLQNIYCNNIPWFTEFFCDLLLQVGLVPMEETDKEILQHVSDKNKLQVKVVWLISIS